MKKICKNCKHAQLSQGTFDDYLICNNSLISEDSGETPPDNGMTYPYNEGGWFAAGKNFGCVNFEKESK